MKSKTMELILASNSPYKRAQFNVLFATYKAINSNFNETHDVTIHPKDLACNLAFNKASHIFTDNPEAIVIGSDQTAALSNGTLLTKPGTKSNASRQLKTCSGQSITFYSAVSILGASIEKTWAVETQVVFRDLSIEEINRYLDKDKPFDCAGSFKVESLGISLFKKVTSDDPTALVGLPLISLSHELRSIGILVP
jgi:septum formation protein